MNGPLLGALRLEMRPISTYLLLLKVKIQENFQISFDKLLKNIEWLHHRILFTIIDPGRERVKRLHLIM